MRHTTRNLIVLGLGLGVSTLVGWLLFRERRGKWFEGRAGHALPDSAALEMPQIVLPIRPSVTEEVVISSKSSAPAASDSGDDLTRVKDIGPKFANALRAIGITHFSQLAEQSPDELASKLMPFVKVRPQRIRDNDWIGQAKDLAKNAHS